MANSKCGVRSKIMKKKDAIAALMLASIFSMGLVLSGCQMEVKEEQPDSVSSVSSVYSIVLDQTESYAFPPAYAGYSAPDSKVVIVMNNGNKPTGS
jgi:hypothetical protein